MCRKTRTVDVLSICIIIGILGLIIGKLAGNAQSPLETVIGLVDSISTGEEADTRIIILVAIAYIAYLAGNN
jgi:hypothetical protein